MDMLWYGHKHGRGLHSFTFSSTCAVFVPHVTQLDT